MRTICACGLNDVNPQLTHPALFLTDVREHPPALERDLATVAGREGTRILRTRRVSLAVSLDFELHELDPLRRLDLCRDLAAWASPGGWLTLSHRPGQRLLVTCDAPPTLTSALQWTQPITVTFTAWEAPWWEAVERTTAADTGTSGTVTLNPPGELDTVLKARFTAQAPVDALTLATAEQTLALTGLALAPGDTLIFDYDDLHLPRLMVGTRSCLHCRDPHSPEDVLLHPGQDNAIAWRSDGALAATFSTRGRFL